MPLYFGIVWDIQMLGTCVIFAACTIFPMAIPPRVMGLPQPGSAYVIYLPNCMILC